MKQKTIINTTYIADDGREFNSADECKRYESETAIPKIHLNLDNVDQRDRDSIVNYIGLIIGQYDIIKDPEIQKVKIIKMLTKIQDEFSGTKPYFSE